MKGTSLIIQIIKSSGFLSDLPLVFLAWFALVSCFELRCRPWDFFHPGYECYIQLCSGFMECHLWVLLPLLELQEDRCHRSRIEWDDLRRSQRTVTQLHRVDDQKAGANGRSRGYLNSLHPTLRFGATSRFLSTSYDNSRLSWSLFVEVWWLPWKNLPETKSSHLKMLFGRWSLSFWA